MKRSRATVIFFGVLAFVSHQAGWSMSYAAELFYNCEVLNTYHLVLPTLMADRTEVLWRGDGENSFRTVAYFKVSDGARPLIQTLDVQEFIKGKQKPFVSFSMGGAGIVTGIRE